MQQDNLKLIFHAMIKSLLIILFLILLISNTVNAQRSEIPDSVGKERIQYIENKLASSKKSVNVWWYGWLGAYSAATIGQGTVYFMSSDKATKQDMALGSATTFLGAALQLLTPLNTGKDAEILAELPENTTEDQQDKLVLAEKLLQSNAMKEKAGRSWQIHALNGAANLSSGLITWLGFKRSVWDGVSNFLLNTVVTETQIWTQPTRTLKDYKNYCRKYKSDSGSFSYQPQPEYFLSTYPGGVSLRIVF